MGRKRELNHQQRRHRQFECALKYDRNALVVLGLFGGWLFGMSSIEPATANWVLDTLSWFRSEFTPHAGNWLAEITPLSLIQSKIVAQLYVLSNVVFISLAIIHGIVGALVGAVSVLETRINTPSHQYPSNFVTRGRPENADATVERRLRSNQQTLWRKQQAWNACAKSIYSGGSHAVIGVLILFSSVYAWPYSLAGVCCLLLLEITKLLLRIRRSAN